MLHPKPIPEEQSRAILDQFYEIEDMANQISQHLDYLEFLLEVVQGSEGQGQAPLHEA